MTGYGKAVVTYGDKKICVEVKSLIVTPEARRDDVILP